MIDVEVIDGQIDYNILLGCSYMYSMKAFTSLVFHMMMFPFIGKAVIVDQLNYYNPNASVNPKNVFPTIRETNTPPYEEISP